MNPTREIDEQFSALFSVFHPFSQHLTKREDNQLRDKYDHNAFMYTGQPSAQEIRQATEVLCCVIRLTAAEKRVGEV